MATRKQVQAQQLDDQDVVCGGDVMQQQQEDDMSATTIDPIEIPTPILPDAPVLPQLLAAIPVAEAETRALDIPTLESRIQAGKAKIGAMKADPKTAPETLAAAIKLFNRLVTDLSRARAATQARKYTTPYIPNHIYSRIRASKRTPQEVADEARSLDKDTPDYALKIHILRSEYKLISNRH